MNQQWFLVDRKKVREMSITELCYAFTELAEWIGKAGERVVATNPREVYNVEAEWFAYTELAARAFTEVSWELVHRKTVHDRG